MEKMRGLVESYYDIQSLRLESESRLRSHKQKRSEQDYVWQKEVIYDRLKEIEADIYKYLAHTIKDEPIWAGWLKNVKGVGPAIMAGLLSWVKIENFATISKLWKYSGLAVGEDGMAMKLKKGQSICWNPKVKTLMWKIGESFVKTKGGYRDLYSQFRKEYDEKWAVMCTSSPKACRERGKCCDGHRFAAAKRKTVKVFEAHYWQKSRLLKGLPIESPFIIGRDSHTHEIPIIER